MSFSKYFLSSKYKKSLVISIDGVGEIETSMFAIGKNSKLKLIDNKNIFPDSLGLIYAAITFYLGWKPFYDEGIVMGLAPLGNKKNIIPGSNKTYENIFKKTIIYNGRASYKINLDWISYHNERDIWLSINFFQLFGRKRKTNGKITQHHKDIAAALQSRIEEVVLNILKYLKKNYKIENLCISGGWV